MVNNKATVFVKPRQLSIISTFNYYVLCVRHCARCEGYCDERGRYKRRPFSQRVYSSPEICVSVYSLQE